jgi:hypothetical protein
LIDSRVATTLRNSPRMLAPLIGLRAALVQEEHSERSADHDADAENEDSPQPPRPSLFVHTMSIACPLLRSSLVG